MKILLNKFMIAILKSKKAFILIYTDNLQTFPSVIIFFALTVYLLSFKSIDLLISNKLQIHQLGFHINIFLIKHKIDFLKHNDHWKLRFL